MKAIQIPNPCAEDWSRMTEQKDGRFCDACETHVRDFTKLSDTQFHYVLSQSKGKICGRVKESQLNRPLIEHTYRNGPDLLRVVLGMTLLLSSYSVQASEIPYSTPSISLIQLLEQDSTKTDNGHEYITTRFILLDKKTSEPIPFVKAKVYNEAGEMAFHVYSDSTGLVSFEMSPDEFAVANVMTLEFIGYQTETLVWDDSFKGVDVQIIQLSPVAQEPVFLGMVAPRTVKSSSDSERVKGNGPWFLRRKKLDGTTDQD